VNEIFWPIAGAQQRVETGSEQVSTERSGA
jgi:hypothetical protein